MRCLITGCNGFVGGWLARIVHSRGYSSLGIDLQDSPTSEVDDYLRLDLQDEVGLYRAVEEFNVSHIYHLAAVASPRLCFQDPVKAFRINIQGCVNVFEVCRKRPQTRALVVGSSEEYQKKDGESIEYFEDDALEPRTIYGVSKKAAEEIGGTYVSNYAANILFTRSFNHTGPGQLPEYVLSDFSKQAALIALERKDPNIYTGNIDLARDFSDVRDVVSAYILLMERGRTGRTYNVASGNPIVLRDLLEHLIHLTGRDDIRIIVDPSRVRAGEPVRMTGNIMRLLSDTGFSPSYSIHKTMEDMFMYWKTSLELLL